MGEGWRNSACYRVFSAAKPFSSGWCTPPSKSPENPRRNPEPVPKICPQISGGEQPRPGVEPRPVPGSGRRSVGREPFLSRRSRVHNSCVATKTKRVERTTLHYKHEFHVDRVSHGKAYVVHEGTPIKVYKSWEKITQSESLGWMERREAKALAKKNGWAFDLG